MDAGSGAAATVAAVSVSRAWIRRDAPAGPFVWGGLLPLLGLLGVALFALLPFARGDIEATVRQVTAEQLNSAGLPWVKAAVSGQDVDLSGTPPDSGAAAQAVQVATEALCPTWAGPKRCAVRVTPHFDAPAAAPAISPSAPPASAVAAAQTCQRELAAIVTASKIEFASGSDVITPASATVLDRLAAVARACAGTLTVAGHTDAQGSPELNRRLSLARATAVREALVARGLAEARLRVEGHGADQPVASNDEAAGRAQNRRIEFRVQADAVQ